MCRFDLKHSRRIILILSLTLAHLNAGGCASKPATLSPEGREQLGRVGVLAVSSAPRLEFHTFAKGWAAGAAKGGSLGAVHGLIESLGEAVRSMPADPYAGPVALIAVTVLTAVGGVSGGVWGAMEAVPKKTAAQIEKELAAAMEEVNLAHDLAREIHAASVSRPDLARYAVVLIEPSASGGMPGQEALSGQGVNTAMEVLVTEAGFRGGSASQPDINFYLNTRVRLASADSGAEMYVRDFQYLSRNHPFAEWFSDDSRKLREVFSHAMSDLAERIVDELFIVTGFPFDSGLWALPGQEEFGACWFRPIYPELRYTSLWHSIVQNEPGIHISYTEAGSLQPLLRWESFPRQRDRKPDNEQLLREISDVTYDLKVWEAASDFPDRLVYDISRLHEPQHRLPFPLKPGMKYFWTFRARYKMSGQPRITRWAFSTIPSNSPSDYPRRRPGGTCDLDAIPATNYFRFITP